MSNLAKVMTQLAGQNHVHGMLGDVLAKCEERAQRELGEGFVENWAWENPGSFIKLLVSCAPSVAAQTGVSGEVQLKVHHSLAPTTLDRGNVIDMRPE